MRRVISFILMLVIVLSLACPALAATNSPADKAPTSGVAAGNAEAKDSDGNPKTGDIIMKWVTILAVSVIALVAVVVIYRKKFA